MIARTLIPALRALTPVGWIAAAAMVVAVLAVVLGGLGFRWDPLDLSRRRLEQARAEAAGVRAEAAARQAEAQAQAGQVARLDAALETGRSLDRVTTLSLQAASTADDALLPLSPDRADRLREHDRRLCDIRPLAGCAAAPDPSGDGGPTLRAPPPARTADPG